MGELLRANRVVVGVWAGLVAVTLGSWWLGTEEGGRGAAVAVILIAWVKVRFVGRHFMELRAAPPALRLAFDAYVVVVGIALVAIYLSAA